MENYVLNKPIEFDGVKVTELNMDLEGLSAAALEAAEKQARMMLAKKENMFVPETNKKYLSCVAAKAAGVKVDLIRSLSAKDYTQVCMLVMNFLLDGDSSLTEETGSEEDPEKPKTLSLMNSPMILGDNLMESPVDLN